MNSGDAGPVALAPQQFTTPNPGSGAEDQVSAAGGGLEIVVGVVLGVVLGVVVSTSGASVVPVETTGSSLGRFSTTTPTTAAAAAATATAASVTIRRRRCGC